MLLSGARVQALVLPCLGVSCEGFVVYVGSRF